MNEKERPENLDFLKKRLKDKFDSLAEPMNQVEYTRENYDRLFPESKVSTPIGEVILRRDQYIKLGNKDRKNLLGAMHQTLTDPVAIINEDRNGYIAKIYTKSFTNNEAINKDENIVSVVPNIKGKDISITTHPRRKNNILNKIKKVGDVIYEKPHSDSTAGDTVNNDNTDDIQLPNNIPQSPPNVKGK
jgi:hypothetical protein